MLLGALSVLMLGTVGMPAMADDAPPPCHETALSHGQTDAPSSDKAMKAMGCCVACVATPALRPPARVTLTHPPMSPSPRLHALPRGRSPAPEHGPPRFLNA